MAVERTGKARRREVKQRWEKRHREEECGARRGMQAVKKKVREEIQ